MTVLQKHVFTLIRAGFSSKFLFSGSEGFIKRNPSQSDFSLCNEIIASAMKQKERVRLEYNPEDNMLELCCFEKQVAAANP